MNSKHIWYAIAILLISINYAHCMNYSVEISPGMQLFINSLGMGDDAAACQQFLKALTNPPRPFEGFTGHKFSRKAALIKKLRISAPITPAERYNALMSLLTKQTILKFDGTEVFDRPENCAIHFGAVPALYAVAKYYLAMDDAQASIDLMRQAHFWDEFGTLCRLSAEGDTSSFSFHYTLANLLKVAPHLLERQQSGIYKCILSKIRGWLNNKINSDDLAACAHAIHLSLMRHMNNERRVHKAFRKIFTLLENDDAILQFIIGNNLKRGLELVASRKGSSESTLTPKARELLARLPQSAH